MELGLLLFVLSVPVWITLVLAVLARLGPASPQRLAIQSCFVASLAVLTVVLAREGFGQALAFSSVLVFSLAHVYFHFFNMSETARRIRILVDLRKGNEPRANDPASMIDVRIDRLLRLRVVEEQRGRLVAPASLLRFVARVLDIQEHFLFPQRTKFHQ